MAQSTDNIRELRSFFQKVKNELDSIKQRLEEEFAASSSKGVQIHRLLKRIQQLETDTLSFEKEWEDIQRAKREFIDVADTLMDNMLTLQNLRGLSGLPKEENNTIQVLQDVVKNAGKEFESP